MKVTALASWFGSNRMLAEEPGRLLADCQWVGVGMAGGMAEVRHMKARTVVVNDLHRHMMNLAMVVSDQESKALLIKRLDDLPFHPDTLASAQERCLAREIVASAPFGGVSWAADYFVSSWMARSSKCGTDDEFNGGLSLRWEAGGGDSAKRYHSAVESLEAWHQVLKRCTFSTLDVFEWLDKCQDRKGHGIYLDPPFPGPGDAYRHKFDQAQHCKLAARLVCFKETRVVCRFYDVPLIRELYPESLWTWHQFTGRKQSNDAAPEVLLVRN